MSTFICASCRASLRHSSRTIVTSIRSFNNNATLRDNDSYSKPRSHEIFEDTRAPSRAESVASIKSHDPNRLDIGSLLSKPTWSVRSLLPDPNTPPSEEINPSKLHHLLRLSALPQPKSPEEEAKMLETLHSQLHFVRGIQKVNTEGIEPLQSIRDETSEGIKEATIGMETVGIRQALEQEDVKGRGRRPRRRREVKERGKDEDWDVMGSAEQKVKVGGAEYFVVRSGKGKNEEP